MYEDLKSIQGPRHFDAAMKYYGLKEGPGVSNNPVIMSWADNPKLPKWVGPWYRKQGLKGDANPWCGLFMFQVMDEAGREVKLDNPLGALNWKDWGVHVKLEDALFGDVSVSKRTGGGHVGIIVGEDPVCFHVLGGNTGDQVRVTRIAKNTVVAVRRPPYNNPPPSVKKLYRAATGAAAKSGELQ